MFITREKFIEATGREPEDDDLQRCNCREAGMLMHLCCGWNYKHNKPQFMIGPQKWNGRHPEPSSERPER